MTQSQAALSTIGDQPITLQRRTNFAAGWFILLALSVVLLVAWGAVVRLSGAGLSIPDWPLINGRLIPPATDAEWLAVMNTYTDEATRVGDPRYPANITLEHFKTLFGIEWTHRALAAIVGIIFFVGALIILQTRELRRKVNLHLSLLTAMLFGQAMLGGVVVKGALTSILVAAHLGLAFLFFGAIIWTSFTLLGTPLVTPGESKSAGLPALAIGGVTMALVFIQIISGGLLAGVEGGKVLNTFPLMAGKLFPLADLIESYRITDTFIGNLLTNKVLLQFIHRWLPVAVIIFYAILRFKAVHIPLVRRGRLTLRLIDGILGMQLVLGIGNLIAGAPAAMSALHTVTALLLFGNLTMLMFDMRFGVSHRGD